MQVSCLGRLFRDPCGGTGVPRQQISGMTGSWRTGDRLATRSPVTLDVLLALASSWLQDAVSCRIPHSWAGACGTRATSALPFPAWGRGWGLGPSPSLPEGGSGLALGVRAPVASRYQGLGTIRGRGG